MQRKLLLSLVAFLAVGCCQDAMAQFLSANRPSNRKGTTLDFVNVTSKRINQTVSEQSGNEKEVEFGDFDNDGDPDIVVSVALSDFTSRRNKLYRNDNGVFNEVSGSSIIPDFSQGEVTRSSFFRDYDGDGWLDLITVSDSNNGFNGQTRFFHNKHPGGVFSHFENETFRLNGAGGAACIAVSFDVDNDGDDDLYLGNYPFNSQDTLYLNDGTGNFTNVTGSNVPTEQDYTVDTHYGDLNGDGKVDLVVTSDFGDPSYIIYNDLNGGGSGVGDYKYSGSRENIGTANQENGAEMGDFNNDGLLDIFFTNKSGNSDRVWVNTGNGADGKANFNEVNIPGFVSSSSSRKATVADLNGDGRLDVIVMGQSRRPAILRNTSVNGVVSFVEWAPANVFPDNLYNGWHAGAHDLNADGRLDIFVGANSNDHMFQNRRSATIKEAALNGSITGVHNSNPLAIIGNGADSETDVYDISSIPAGSDLSIVLNSSVDVSVAVVSSIGVVLHEADRGGAGIEEAMQVTAPSNGKIHVTVNSGTTALRPYILEVLSRD